MRLMDQGHRQHPYHGSRRIRDWLEDQGLAVDRHHAHRLYPYLLRGLSIERANQVWAADVTYVPLADGFAYRVAIIDSYSRKVLAWRLSNTMDSGFCVEALARRYFKLDDEIADYDAMIKTLVDELAPRLIARHAVEYESAVQLLITAGDYSQRLQSEASFAALCGASPIPASSGKKHRH